MEDLVFNKEQVDVLREIGTIGAGNAATALSQIMARKVSITIPRVHQVLSEKVSSSRFAIAPDELSLAVELKILGSLQGGLFVLFSQKSALLMIDVLLKRPFGTTQLLNVLEVSALLESVQILAGCYLNVIGDLLELRPLLHSIPQPLIDRMDKLQNWINKKFVANGPQYLLPIENNLTIENMSVQLYVVFLLEFESIKKIFKVVGL